MEKEWISAFYDNEGQKEELHYVKSELDGEETGNLLELYREIGNHLRSQNPVPEVSENFQKNLRLCLQAEYDRTEYQADVQEKVTVNDHLQKNKAEAL